MTRQRVVRNDRGHRIGQSHHRAKLTDAQVDEIVALREQGLYFRLIAERFGVGETIVKDICSGKRRGQLASVGPVTVRTSGADTAVAPLAWQPLLRAWRSP